jgi:hypothetical protein
MMPMPSPLLPQLRLPAQRRVGRAASDGWRGRRRQHGRHCWRLHPPGGAGGAGGRTSHAVKCGEMREGHDVFERTTQVLGGAAAMRAMHGRVQQARGCEWAARWHGGPPPPSAGGPKKFGWFITV